MTSKIDETTMQPKTMDEKINLVSEYFKQRGIEVTSLLQEKDALRVIARVGPTRGPETNPQKEYIRQVVVSKLYMPAIQGKDPVSVVSTDFFPLTNPITEGGKRTEQQLSRDREHYGFKLPLKIFDSPKVLSELERVGSLPEPLLLSATRAATLPLTDISPSSTTYRSGSFFQQLQTDTTTGAAEKKMDVNKKAREKRETKVSTHGSIFNDTAGSTTKIRRIISTGAGPLPMLVATMSNMPVKAH
jgi:hypothetical protein